MFLVSPPARRKRDAAGNVSGRENKPQRKRGLRDKIHVDHTSMCLESGQSFSSGVNSSTS